MPFVSQLYALATTTWNAVPAVYGITNQLGQMIYVGETDDLRRRMAEHMANRAHPMHRYGPAGVYAEVNAGGEFARRSRESVLIHEYQPPANKQLIS